MVRQHLVRLTVEVEQTLGDATEWKARDAAVHNMVQQLAALTYNDTHSDRALSALVVTARGHAAESLLMNAPFASRFPAQTGWKPHGCGQAAAIAATPEKEIANAHSFPRSPPFWHAATTTMMALIARRNSL